MKEIKDKLKEEIIGVRDEIRERTVGYILTALGLVAGLAWNDAIKGFIEYVFPADQTGNTLKAKFAYAVMITAAVVVASGYLARLSRKNGKKREEDVSVASKRPAKSQKR